MPQDELQRLQQKKLHALISYVCTYSEFYKRRLKNAGVTPDDIKTLNDLQKLPFAVKKDFRDAYPTGTFCVPQNQLVRYLALILSPFHP